MLNYSKNQLYIIKMKNQATILNRFREFLNNSEDDTNPPAYYNLTNATSIHDRNVFNDMETTIDVHYWITRMTRSAAFTGVSVINMKKRGRPPFIVN